MPYRKCHFGCDGKYKTFSFPKEESARQQWIQFLYMGEEEQPHASVFVCYRHFMKPTACVCSRHFTKESFTNLAQYEAGFADRLRLHEGAVPTIKGRFAGFADSEGRTMSGRKQKDPFSLWTAKDQHPPKKVARSEEIVLERREMVDQAMDETVEKAAEEAVEETETRKKQRASRGAATYRCTFKTEWSTKWPFITKGTTGSCYWCSVCRQENSCAHQGVTDVNRHIKSKGHQAKERARNTKLYVLAPVGGMTTQDAKIAKYPPDQVDTVTIKSEVLSESGGEMDSESAQCKVEPRRSAETAIGFVGAGNMAFGIAQGILMSGEVSAESVKVSAPSANNLGRFQEMGVAVTHSNTEVVSSSRVVFLAVKPHLIPAVLQEIAGHVTQEHVIVSVAAGVTVATLESLLPPDSVVLRLMPNLPCVVQEGALLFSRGSKARPEHGALLRGLLAPCGLVEEGPESWIDAHTGMSGSGVAFVYLFAEALAEGGVKMGMPSALAHRIAAQTVLGAGRLLRDSGKHAAQLRADVCTPGGTTIYGLHELERGGVRAAAIGAVEAATERARELGRK